MRKSLEDKISEIESQLATLNKIKEILPDVFLDCDYEENEDDYLSSLIHNHPDLKLSFFGSWYQFGVIPYVQINDIRIYDSRFETGSLGVDLMSLHSIDAIDGKYVSSWRKEAEETLLKLNYSVEIMKQIYNHFIELYSRNDDKQCILKTESLPNYIKNKLVFV